MTTIETSARLPRSFDEFTADWFSKALSRQFPGAIVSGFSRNSERVGTSASCRFELTYANCGEGDDAPNVVYLKGGFTEQQLNRYWMVLQQEARFYSALSHDVPTTIPRHYFAAIDEEKQGITMLEDLVSRNVRFGFWGELTVGDVAGLLEQFAALHARWLGDARLPSLAGWEVPQREFLKYLVRDKHWEELTGRAYGPELIEAIPEPRLVRAALERLWALNDAARRTLVHGDAHGGNMYFAPDGAPGILDWQLCFAGTPMHDVSWLIVSGLNIEDRPAEEARLLKTYAAAAAAHGTEMPDFDAIWLSHRQQMVHAFVSGACEPRESGPVEAINAAARVAIAAANDHDVLDALGVAGI